MFRLNVGNFGVLLYDVPLHVEVRVTTLDLEALIFGLMWSRNASHTPTPATHQPLTEV